MKKREGTTNQYSQNDINQRLTLQDLKLKTSAILSRTNNDPETEQDFRRTCALFENQKSSPQLKRAYQDYVSAYTKISSLYILLWGVYRQARVHVFDTENESRQVYKLKSPTLSNLWSTAVIPNGNLLCCGDLKNLGIVFIVNSDFKVKVIQTGEHCKLYPSAIYLNRSVYILGGMTGNGISWSSKYDLDANRWFKLPPVPTNDFYFSCAIFNGSIVISGYNSRNLVFYSVDIESFSTIPYDFENNGIKLLINAGRLYLIECLRYGIIYESEAEDIYSWKQVGESIIDMNCQMHGLYNKGSIYIIPEDEGQGYYKFDLSQKTMFRISEKNKKVKR